MVVREREYDIMSWHGLKTIASVVITALGVLTAVLVTYYSAEAAQNDSITKNTQRLDDNDRRLNDTFEKFHEALNKQEAAWDEQRRATVEHTKTVTRMDTRKVEVILPAIERLDKKIDEHTHAP